MTVYDFVNLINDDDEFSIYRKAICVQKPITFGNDLIKNFIINEKLVFKGNKHEFLNPLLTDYECKIDSNFSLVMAKNRHIVSSFSVHSISLNDKKIVVIDPEQRLVNIV